jgi:hypothetical protein
MQTPLRSVDTVAGARPSGPTVCQYASLIQVSSCTLFFPLRAMRGFCRGFFAFTACGKVAAPL